MSTDLVLLAALMFLVTYPARALGILTPGLERLPRPALDYLQLVGPAVLAALAGVGVLVDVDGAGRATFHAGIEASPWSPAWASWPGAGTCCSACSSRS